MNKYFWIIIILILPIVAAGIWYMSVSSDVLTASNVSAVVLEHPDGSHTEYTSIDDKQFFVDFKSSIVSIEKQDYNSETHSLYKLKFERVQGDVQYYLCLSADVKNCLAFDSNGDWYRIDKEYAKKFLTLHDTSSVYRNSEVPNMTFVSNGIDTVITPSEAQWFYLLSDETYSEVSIENSGSSDNGLYVLSGDDFDISFDIKPDWYNVKIYDGEELLFDELSGNFTEFSYNDESKLRAVITAEWYADTTPFYYGKVVYDILFDYDIRATFAIDKKEAYPGEAIYINLMHVDNEALEITTSIPSAEKLSEHSYANGKLVILPIPSYAEAGEYKISVKSEKTSISIPITVKSKVFETVKIGFVGSESADSYNSAQALFNSEIASAFDVVETNAEWINGLLTPVKKFVGGIEQYWVSLPSFGVIQNVEGTVISERSKGIHYVKAIAADSLPARSAANGTVAFAGTTTLYGNTVVIEHGLGFKTVYGHLDSINVSVGQSINAGDVIANADPSGFAVSSTELFFGICVDGVFLNPYNFINEPRTESGSDISDPIDFIVNIQTKLE